MIFLRGETQPLSETCGHQSLELLAAAIGVVQQRIGLAASPDRLNIQGLSVRRRLRVAGREAFAILEGFKASKDHDEAKTVPRRGHTSFQWDRARPRLLMRADVP